MAMTILNNTSAMMSLGELNKNITEVGKQLAKIASGQRIVGARDGASDFAISEKMRVKLRVGGQNDVNVKTGYSMLQVAEGGIQEQIRLMRSIQGKVIDACNDTNTDLDRATIQKEIDQYYRQIQDIAVETEYNGKKLLMGGDFRMETAYYWRRVSSSEVRDDGEMDIIPDVYETLDGVEGPFDIFTEWGGREPTTIAALGLSSTQNLSGGTDGTPHTFEMDLARYGSISALDKTGFLVGGRRYVFTSTPGGTYRETVTEISLVGCSSMDDVVNRAASAVNGYYYSTVTAENKDGKLVFTSKEKSSAADSETVTAITLAGGTNHIPATEGRDAVPPTGLSGIPANFSGGKNATGEHAVPGDPDSHETFVPATRASLSVSVAGVAASTGFTIRDRFGNTYCIEFSDDDTAGLTRTETRGTTTYYKVGRNATASFSSGDIDFVLSGGTMTVTSRTAGSAGNNNRITDGIAAVPGTDARDVTYTAVSPYDVSTVRTLTNWTDDGNRAHYDIDLSGYITSDSDKLESFIKNLVDKSITFTDYRERSYGSTSSSVYKYREQAYTFVDSKNDLPLDSRVTPYSGVQIDLNELRDRVGAATTIADAFAEMMKSKVGSANLEVTTSDDSDAGVVNGIKFLAGITGTVGNNDQLLVEKTGGLRHYDIDYGSYFASHPVDSIPEFLDGKGFRFYCATHDGQWFNIEFVNAAGISTEKPTSGTEGEDIKSIIVDVSGVTDAGSLVQAIYDQATPILTGDDPNYNHYMRVGGNVLTGVLRIYDWRRYNVNTPAYDYQERGAKISDGAADNIVLMSRDIYVQDLVIQHTDKQNMNIHVKIPRTTIDQILGFDPAEYEVGEFNVLSKEMRENLLGTRGQRGLIDRGIEYLLNANTLIGAQLNRLNYAGENIATQNENLTASESVIRDADMAKEMLAFTKSQILSQGSQGMLAQANQNAASVLGLLQ